MRFVARSQAHRAAKSRGYMSWRTEIDPKTGTWKVTEIQYPSPAAEWAKGKEFVAWVETAFVDKKAVGVLIVHLTKEELAGENIPPEFIVEPVTPELFNQSTGGVSKGERKSSGGGDRARSTTAEGVSPTKLVWQIADECHSSKQPLTKEVRAHIIGKCIEQGVNKATANTQLYRWSKARGIGS